jgi:hypothetical protein
VRLKEENTKLVLGLKGLADCMGSLGQESCGHDEDLSLARKTALAATLTSFRVEGLALMLDWEPSQEYVQIIWQIRSILADVAEVEAENVAAPCNLAERLNSAKWNLQQWIIPDDLRSCLSRPARAMLKSTNATDSETHVPGSAKGATTPSEAITQLLNEVRCPEDESVANPAPVGEPIEITKNLNTLD